MYEVLWAVGCNCSVTSTLRNIQGTRRTPIFLQQRNRLDFKVGGSGCRKMTLDRWRVRSGKLRAGREMGLSLQREDEDQDPTAYTKAP